MEKESYDSRIKKLEKALKEASNDRSKALARYDMLQKDLEQIHKRIEELGCQPEELDARIKEIRNEMDLIIKEIEQLIPGQYLKSAGW
ncbi:MAG: hypothetical protein GXY92_02170 [Syntrophomonadaceae bacterium]|nr:hypothetical protein [Syntrophomonadaceae bacterium]